MRKQLSWVGLAGVVLAVGFYARNALATPSSGFMGTTLAVGRFGDIDVPNYFIGPDTGNGAHGSVWLSFQKTKGPSDLYVQSNVWEPGGTTGWHTHPGHSLIIVTAGTVTAYEGDDPDCTPHVYTQGQGFVDEGGDHVHVIRNEGGVEARTTTVQLIPADATRRVDAPSPGNCRF